MIACAWFAHILVRSRFPQLLYQVDVRRERKKKKKKSSNAKRTNESKSKSKPSVRPSIDVYIDKYKTSHACTCT